MPNLKNPNLNKAICWSETKGALPNTPLPPAVPHSPSMDPVLGNVLYLRQTVCSLNAFIQLVVLFCLWEHTCASTGECVHVCILCMYSQCVVDDIVQYSGGRSPQILYLSSYTTMEINTLLQEKSYIQTLKSKDKQLFVWSKCPSVWMSRFSFQKADI